MLTGADFSKNAVRQFFFLVNRYTYRPRGKAPPRIPLSWGLHTGSIYFNIYSAHTFVWHTFITPFIVCLIIINYHLVPMAWYFSCLTLIERNQGDTVSCINCKNMYHINCFLLTPEDVNYLILVLKKTCSCNTA